MDFNPRSQRRERHAYAMPRPCASQTSIHAPSEGSDNGRSPGFVGSSKLQSTLPAKGATFSIFYHLKIYRTSIHAPSEGSDCEKIELNQLDKVLQSTLPAKGATLKVVYTFTSSGTSIHAPSEGSDFSLFIKIYNNITSIHAPSEGSD